MHGLYNQIFKICFYVPPLLVGDILLVRIALASASAFISVHYLLNKWMDFDQTCIDTLLGGGEELIRFW